MNTYPIKLVPADRLTPSPYNSWSDEENDGHQRSCTGDLATSIRNVGLLTPLTVIGPYQDGHYEILAGVRRYNAIMVIQKDDPAFLPEIPCCVVGGSDMHEDYQRLIVDTANLERDLSKQFTTSEYRFIKILRSLADCDDPTLQTMARNWAGSMRGSYKYSGLCYILFPY